MPENFEKPSPGEELRPEEEVPGEKPEEGAEEVRMVEKEPETPEQVEAEFDKRISELTELRQEIAKEYNKDSFDNLEKIAERMIQPGEPPEGKDPVLIGLVIKVREKWHQIETDRREKLAKLAEQRREKLGKRVGEI